jgi:transketolase
MVNKISNSPLDERSNYLRSLVVRALQGGNRGHIGSSMSLIEILRVLFDDILKFKSNDPSWEDRDRLILSKGHGCLALYALLADKKFFNFSELDKFCHDDGMLGGHPERNKIPGVEASTGALGHGLSIGVGMALALKIRKKSSKVFVIVGDGEINEGSVWEAAMCAGNHNLENLIVMIDYNKIQSYGFTEEVADLEPLVDKWKAFNFNVIEVDGHNVEEIKSILEKKPSKKPLAVICHTVKGKGIGFAENDPKWHHKSNLDDSEIEDMYKSLEVEIQK